MKPNPASATPPLFQPIPNMIAVASGKGGVGKTWTSITLANALAYLGERVILFDGDLGLANVDVQLGLAPEADLGAVVSGKVGLADAVCGYMGGAGEPGQHKGGGFDVLAGQSGSGALAALRSSEMFGLVQGLRSLGESYDRIIVDTAAGIDRAVTTLAAMSGITLVVLTEDPTSLTDAYAFVKVMSSRAKGADMRILVNMADDHERGRRAYQALNTACKNFLDLDLPLAGVVIRDANVKDAIKAQAPILAKFPKSEAGAAITKLASGLRNDK